MQSIILELKQTELNINKVNEVREYKVVYMLPINMGEQSADEFIQKFEQEIIQQNGSIQATEKNKSQMVRTSTNKNARSIYLVTTYFSAPTTAISELIRFLKLAQGIVVNYLFLKIEKPALKAA